MRAALAMLVTAVAACTGSPSGAPMGTTAEAIVDGETAGDLGDSVVLLVRSSSNGTDVVLCTGTMIGTHVVLTARHCVADTPTEIVCATSVFSESFDPSTFHVFGGPTRPTGAALTTEGVRGTRIATTTSSTVCNNDVALIVLDAPVAGAVVSTMRLDGGPSVDDALTLVGWGVNANDQVPRVKQARGGVPVLAIGPTSKLGKGEFLVGEGPCEGDSGGPAFEADGTMVGVLSRGSTESGCSGAQSVYTDVAAFRDLITSTLESAGDVIPVTASVAPADATAAAAPPSDSSGGCNASGRSPASGDAIVFLFAALVLVAARVRSRLRVRATGAALILLLVPSLARADDRPSTPEATGRGPQGVYLAAETKLTKITNDLGLLVGGHAAWVTFGRLALGGAGYVLATTHTPVAQLNPPGSDATISMWYAGGRVAYDVLGPKSGLHLSLGSLVGGGNAEAKANGTTGTGSAFGGTGFMVVEPLLDMEAELSKNVSIVLALSWRWVPPTHTAGLSSTDLGGPAAGLALRYGVF